MASRMNFANILSKYKQQGKGNVRLTQSTLYVSRPINTGSTSYNFEILETQNATLQANEIKLNINDEFIVTALGVYTEYDLRVGGIVVGKTILPYLPIQNTANAAALAPLYQGALQISVNNIVYMDKFDTAKCQVAPITQLGSLIAGTDSASQDATNLNRDGMVKIEPMLTLSGAKKNTVQLQIPQAISVAPTFIITLDDATTVTYTAARIVFRAFGLNAQNGSAFQ